MSEVSNDRNPQEDRRRFLEEKAVQYRQTPDLSNLWVLLHAYDAIIGDEESVGNVAGALDACQQAVSLMEGFRSERSAGSDFFQALAGRYLKLAELYAAGGGVAETIHAVQEALSLWRDLPPEDLSTSEVSQQVKAAHQKGIAILERLIELHPEHEALTRTLNETYLYLGSHCEQLGEDQEALQLYEGAATAIERLQARKPHALDDQLIQTYRRLAEYHFYRELPADALHWLQKESTLLFHQVERVGADSSLLLAAGNNLWNRAHLHFRLGEAEKAFECYQTAIDYLSWYEPEHKDLTVPLIQLYLHLGMSHDHREGHELALKAYNGGIPIAEKLYNENPDDSIAYLLADLYMHAGLSHSKMANYPLAEALYLRAVRLQERMAEHNPAILGQAASTCDLLARMYRNIDEKEKAISYYEKAIDFYQKLSDMQPDDVFVGTSMAFAYQDMADLKEALGRVEEALEVYERAIDQLRSLMEMHPESRVLSDHFVDSFFRIAWMYRRRGAQDAVIAALERALDTFQTLSLQKGPVKEILSGIHRAYEMLAELLSERDGDTGMRMTYERAVRFWEELSRVAPDDIITMDTLADYYTILGRIYGDDPEPYEKALAIWRHIQTRPDCQIMYYPDKVAGLCVLLAGLYERMGEEEKSHSAYEEATATAERVYLMRNGHIAGLQWMILGYNGWAESLQRKGMFDQALRAYQRIMSLWATHKEDGFLKDGFFQLAFESHLKAAALYNTLNRSEEALACLAEPTAFMEALRENYPDEPALRDSLLKIYTLYENIYQQLGHRDKAEFFHKKKIQLSANEQ